MSSETFVEPVANRLTLAQIAKDASVSMSTVSKVLNGRSGISPLTRERIELLLQDQGYNRRGVENTQGSLIEIVFERIDSGWALELIRGVERVARENSLSVVLTECDSRHALADEWMVGVMQRRPVGVILVFSELKPEHKRQLRTRNIPFVVVDPAGEPAPDVPRVGSANWSGGFAATQHLLELGHRRIGLISGPTDMMCAQARAAGYWSALSAAGVQADTSLMLEGNFDRDTGIRLGTALLQLNPRPTAIFAGNDLQALGVYEAARALGVSIPEELSVVGFDDLEVSGWVSPPLTTVHQPLIEMAEEATRLVLRLRSQKEADNLRLDLATTLVVRGSTQAPQSGR